jgi:excisionase family DNA binding protein
MKRHSSPPALPPLWSVAELSAAWKVPEPTIYAWLHQGLLPYRRIGKRLIRFSDEDIAEFTARSAPDDTSESTELRSTLRANRSFDNASEAQP